SGDVVRFDLAAGSPDFSFGTGSGAFGIRVQGDHTCPAQAMHGSMSGGGTFGQTTKVTHGMAIHCDAGETPNMLEINWAVNKFHMEQLTSASCSNDPNTPPNDKAGFNKISGTGTGRLNGVAATVDFLFTDGGEP